MKRVLAVIFGMLCSMAQAGEIATTIRVTDLKAKPYTDADTLASLAQSSKVEVLVRRSSWMQVKSTNDTGWVKMLSLKFSNADNKSGDSGLGALFNVASKGSSGSTVTTGVRGLSVTDLKNAKPNPKAFEIMQGYAVDKSAAQKFARSGKLQEKQMDYVAEPAPGDGK